MKTHYLVAEKTLEKITKMKTSIFFWVGLWLVGKRVEGIKGKGKKNGYVCLWVVGKLRMLEV